MQHVRITSGTLINLLSILLSRILQLPFRTQKARSTATFAEERTLLTVAESGSKQCCLGRALTAMEAEGMLHLQVAVVEYRYRLYLPLAPLEYCHSLYFPEQLGIS